MVFYDDHDHAENSNQDGDYCDNDDDNNDDDEEEEEVSGCSK